MTEPDMKPVLQAVMKRMEEHAIEIAQELIDDERKGRARNLEYIAEKVDRIAEPLKGVMEIPGLIEKLDEITGLLKEKAQEIKPVTVKQETLHLPPKPYKPAAYEMTINRDGSGMMKSVTMTPKVQ